MPWLSFYLIKLLTIKDAICWNYSWQFDFLRISFWETTNCNQFKFAICFQKFGLLLFKIFWVHSKKYMCAPVSQKYQMHRVSSLSTFHNCFLSWYFVSNKMKNSIFSILPKSLKSVFYSDFKNLERKQNFNFFFVG